MENKINDLYKLWCNKAVDDEDLVNELKEKESYPQEINDMFYTNLKFGTAGLRGIIGAGTNRMNIYTVRQATQGLANYLNKNFNTPSVAISFDSRIKSEIFAKEAAKVLAANNIKVFISSELQPVPVVSFATRFLKCNSGIMITASHNPAKYNGYKCYGSDGCQITDETANSIYEEIQSVNMFDDVKLIDFSKAKKQNLINYFDEKLYDNYIKNVKAQSIRPGFAKDAKLKVVYTPLNGAGNKMVKRILNETGVFDIVTVSQQEYPDGNFPTCPYPNPEIHEAMECAINLAKEVKPDLILATDPDSDRVGIAVENNGEYELISGNENGAMMFEYILSSLKELGKMPNDPVAVKTIVTTELAQKIADNYNVNLINVLTGFKWIGNEILKLEQIGQEDRYLFGFEESYGYLVGTYVRDKDAVVASMMICEMAAYYKKTQNRNLYEVLQDLYKKYGYYKNKTLSFEFEGELGMKKIQSIMQNLRENPIKSICNIPVIKIEDYLTHESINLKDNSKTKLELPKSNVISFKLEGGSSVVIRPSGTEPKLKAYITATHKSENKANELRALFCKNIENKIININ